MLTEKAIERLFVRKVQERGGLSYKFVSPGNIGVPDRIVITPSGEVLFVELKTETGRLSPVQEHQLERLRRQNCNAIVLYGKEEVEKAVTAIFGGAEKGGDIR